MIIKHRASFQVQQKRRCRTSHPRSFPRFKLEQDLHIQVWGKEYKGHRL